MLEDLARVNIDIALEGAGWLVQGHGKMNSSAGQGVAVREFPMASGHGRASINAISKKVISVIEAEDRRAGWIAEISAINEMTALVYFMDGLSADGGTL